MDNVAPILAPDKSLMVEHLGLLFGRAMEGRIEVTAIKAVPRDEPVQPRTKFFRVDQLDEAADWAAEVNADHLWNVYIGAALRQDDVFPGKAADDADFLKTYAVWADADNQAQVDTARAGYTDADLSPSFIVVTGRTPERRAQYWWTLETPISDIEAVRATVRGIADALGSDHGVLTGKQLMRLAGSLAWPKPNKPGRILERTELIRPDNAAREVQIERIHRAFPPAARPEPREAAPEPAGSLSGAMAAHDLRSALAAMRSDDRELWIRMGHALKALGDVGRGLWLEWSQTSDKYDPADAARVWESFKPNHTDHRAVFAEAQRQGWANPGRGQGVAPGSKPVAVDDPEDVFEVLSMADLAALPDVEWLVKDTIPAGGLGFIYGAPGSFKSFVCYDLALTLAYGVTTWLGREIKPGGGVLYIANEGASGARKRITAWQRRNGIAEDSDAFHLIRKSMSFVSADDVARLERTVAAHVAAHGPVATIFVDTVSRVLPGADENLQKDMTVFVAACDRLREAFGAAVIGVHHTNKNGDMRGSTVFLGQGDCIFRVDRSEATRGGVLTCEKQKDAEDGWKRAFEAELVEWIPAGKIEAVSSLVAVFGGEPGPDDPTSSWPKRDVLQAMQRELARAFKDGAPLSLVPQTKKTGRFAPVRLAEVFDVRSDVVKDVLQTWLDKGVVVDREADSHSKMRGLEVVKWLD